MIQGNQKTCIILIQAELEKQGMLYQIDTTVSQREETPLHQFDTPILHIAISRKTIRLL